MKRFAWAMMILLVLASAVWGGKIEFQYPSGSTLYAVIRKPADATVWNGSAWVTWADPNIAMYDVALSDGSGDYYAVDFPAGIAAGTYTVGVYLQAAGAPAISDTLLGADSMGADGVPKVDVIQWNGTAVASPDTAGYPVVTIKDGTGAGEINTNSGAVVEATALSASGVTAIWDKDISAYVGVGYAGTYVKTLYDDWIDGGRLDLILDGVKSDTDAYDTDAEHAAAVWNALAASYGGAGTYGQAVEDIEADTSAVDTTTEMRTFLTGADTPVAKEATLGTPVALDGGLATLGSMLTKMADDNGGASFDATNDSLHELYVQIGDPNGGTVAASFGIIEAFVDSLEAWIAAPIALDGGVATVTGMLTKLADDAGGTDFDAGFDSLAKQHDYAVDANSVIHAHIGDPNSGDNLAADIAVVETMVDSLEASMALALGWYEQTSVAAGAHTTQTFILAAGPSTDAYYGHRAWYVIVVDATDGMLGGSVISGYTGATKTVNVEDPLPFTPAQNDLVFIMPIGPMAWPNWAVRRP